MSNPFTCINHGRSTLELIFSTNFYYNQNLERKFSRKNKGAVEKNVATLILDHFNGNQLGFGSPICISVSNHRRIEYIN